MGWAPRPPGLQHTVCNSEKRSRYPLGPSLDPHGEPPPNLEFQPNTKRKRSPSWVLPASTLSLKPVDQTCFARTLNHNCCRKADFGSTQVRMRPRGTDDEPIKQHCIMIARTQCSTAADIFIARRTLFTPIKLLLPNVQAHSQLHLAPCTLHGKSWTFGQQLRALEARCCLRPLVKVERSYFEGDARSCSCLYISIRKTTPLCQPQVQQNRQGLN